MTISSSLAKLRAPLSEGAPPGQPKQTNASGLAFFAWTIWCRRSIREGPFLRASHRIPPNLESSWLFCNKEEADNSDTFCREEKDGGMTNSCSSAIYTKGKDPEGGLSEERVGQGNLKETAFC